jgi:hypothetical protein
VPLAEVLDNYDGFLCPTMAHVARPVEEDDTIWYQERGDGLYHGLDMTAPFNFFSPCPP